MTKIYFLGYTLALLSLTSCSTVKLYPICYTNCSRYVSQQEKSRTAQNLADVIDEHSNSVIVDSYYRGIYARTNRLQHKRISKIWPRIACIGKTTTGTEITKNYDCVLYLKVLLNKKNYSEYDIKPNPVHSDQAPGDPHVICCCNPR